MATSNSSKTPAFDFIKSAVNRRFKCSMLNKSRRAGITAQNNFVAYYQEIAKSPSPSEERSFKLMVAHKQALAKIMPGNYLKNIDTINLFINKYQSK